MDFTAEGKIAGVSLTSMAGDCADRDPMAGQTFRRRLVRAILSLELSETAT